jgi:RimJ/RimL family protein N-acetyltransferase
MIRLEQFGRNDFEQLISWISDESLLTNWSGSLFNFPLTKESLDWYISDTNVNGSSDAFVFKAVNTGSGETVGHISLGGLSWKNRSARISRVLTGNHLQRNRGCCRAMIDAVLKIGFEELNLHRISLGVYDDNIAALKCYEKSGFKEEGVSRDILWQNEGWRSMIEMSILENEWRKMKLN